MDAEEGKLLQSHGAFGDQFLENGIIWVWEWSSTLQKWHHSFLLHAKWDDPPSAPQDEEFELVHRAARRNVVVFG